MLRPAGSIVSLLFTLPSTLLAQATWTDRTTASTPAFTTEFAAAYDSSRHVLVMFGGQRNTSGSSTIVNDTWEWDGSSWTLRTFAVKPSARWKHGMAFDSARGVIVMSGGLNYSSSRQPTTWEYDGTAWVLRHTAATNQEVYNHRMAYDGSRGQVVRFGGGTAGGFNANTHVWNGSTWTLASSGGPSVRDGHMMDYDATRQRIVLFGGWNAGYLQDTWEWNGTNWQQRFPLHVPPVRAEGGMAYTGTSRKVALCGGHNLNSTFGDTWTWDGTDWTQLFPTGSLGTRDWFDLVYDATADRVVLLDNADPGLPGYSIHWELNVPTTAPATFATFGTGCASSAGLPQLAAAPGSLPFVGGPFTVQMTGIPGSLFNPAFLMSGFSTTSWNGAPLPQELSAFGMPGCWAWIAPAATELLVNNGGVAAKTWAIPLAPALVGVEFHVQGAVMDQGINAAWFALSNAGTLHIGQV